MMAKDNYFGYVHLTDIVQVTIEGFRTVTQDDKSVTEVNLITRVNSRIVADRWYRQTEIGKVTIDLRLGA
jgi:hypothetical protein